MSIKIEFAPVVERWKAFWIGENPRPMVWGNCIKDDREIWALADKVRLPYPLNINGDYRQMARNAMTYYRECTEYVADEVPAYCPSFGPDQFAAFFGVKLNYSVDSGGTSWSEPMPGELSDILPLEMSPENVVYKGMLELAAVFADEAKSDLVVGNIDMHSNFDGLSAARDPQNACVDLLMYPDESKTALEQIDAIYSRFTKEYAGSARQRETGSHGWTSAYCEDLFNTIQCDFICLLSPAMADEFVIPYLARELDVLDHSIYHLDGPEAIPHLDSLLSLKKLDGVQWVPIAGPGKPMADNPHWYELYHRILDAGKFLHIAVNAEMAKTIHRELRSNRVIYNVGDSPANTRELLEWLEKN